MLAIENRPLERLVPYAYNARTHSPGQIAQIAASIAEFGFVNPILIDSDGGVIAGHGRLLAARQLGLAQAPVIVLDHLSATQKRALLIADNRIAESAGWDEETLRNELTALRDEEFDLDVLGFDDAEILRLLGDDDLEVLDAVAVESHADPEPLSGTDTAQPVSRLADRFGVPPFSVLDARKGWWQERKRAWLDLGIRSELGRGGAPGGSPRPLDRGRAENQITASPGGSPLPAADYGRSKARGDGRCRPIG